MIITRKRIRLLCETSSMDGPKDVMTSKYPELWRGNDVQFELGVFYSSAIMSIEDLASITLNVTDGVGGDLLMSDTIDTASMDNTLDADSWEDGSKQHALITFTGVETNLTLGTDEPSKDFWLVIVAQTNNSPAREITLAAGTFTIKEDGYDTGGTPPTPSVDYYTQIQSDARYMLASSAGVRSRWHTDGQLYIENADHAGWWHPLVIKGDPSQPYFEPAPGVELP